MRRRIESPTWRPIDPAAGSHGKVPGDRMAALLILNSQRPLPDPPNGRSALTAGTALHAPQPTFDTAQLSDRLVWQHDIPGLRGMHCAQSLKPVTYWLTAIPPVVLGVRLRLDANFSATQPAALTAALSRSTAGRARVVARRPTAFRRTSNGVTEQHQRGPGDRY